MSLNPPSLSFLRTGRSGESRGYPDHTFQSLRFVKKNLCLTAEVFSSTEKAQPFRLSFAACFSALNVRRGVHFACSQADMCFPSRTCHSGKQILLFSPQSGEILRSFPVSSPFLCLTAEVFCYASRRSSRACFSALFRATPRMGAKITATTPLNREEGSLLSTTIHAPAASIPASSMLSRKNFLDR